MPIPTLTNEVVIAAILGFEEQRRRIDAQIADLRAMLTGETAEPSALSKSAGPRRGRMSAAGRKAIAEAQRKRWAASKSQSEVPAAPKRKRKLSAAGRAAIVAALKKRWAVKKAGAAKQPGKRTAAKQ